MRKTDKTSDFPRLDLDMLRNVPPHYERHQKLARRLTKKFWTVGTAETTHSPLCLCEKYISRGRELELKLSLRLMRSISIGLHLEQVGVASTFALFCALYIARRETFIERFGSSRGNGPFRAAPDGSLRRSASGPGSIDHPVNACAEHRRTASMHGAWVQRVHLTLCACYCREDFEKRCRHGFLQITFCSLGFRHGEVGSRTHSGIGPARS